MPTLKTETKVKTVVMAAKKPFDLIIIGGGPAGLTAGIYAKRSKIDTVLIEKAVPGGLITTSEMIENYPGFPDGITGVDLGKRMEDQARKTGLDIIFGRVIQIETSKNTFSVHTDNDTFTARSIIIATGGDPKKLGIKGEEAFTGKGVSYCATCDGPFYKDKKVAVIGDDNLAIEEALSLTKHANTVTIFPRKNTMRAEPILQDRAKSNPKIFFMFNAAIEEIAGDKKVSSIKIKDNASGNRSSVEVDGVFIYAGHKANTDFMKGQIKLDENGKIVTDDDLATNVPGIFAAGDVRAKDMWQAITSAADGAIAANSVRKFLENK